MRDYVFFYLNDVPMTLKGRDIFSPLSRLIRDKLALTGTKIVCEEGDCGACTVLIGKIPINKNANNNQNIFQYQPINSCILPSYYVDKMHVVTIEGVGSSLSQVQKTLANYFGSQCGYCTPGIVMTLTGIFENRSQINEQALKQALVGNLCRCTGYQSIIRAGLNIKPKKKDRLLSHYPTKQMIKNLKAKCRQSIIIKNEQRSLFCPTNKKELQRLLTSKPKGTIGAGFTDLGVLTNKNDWQPTKLISLNKLSFLNRIKLNKSNVIIGSNVTLTELQNSLVIKNKIPHLRILLQNFASPQIKNVATLAGNIANASPIGDTLPLLMVMEANLNILGSKKERKVSILNFFQDYKQIDLKANEIISSISIPIAERKTIVRYFKVAKRTDLDIATVGVAFYFKFKSNSTQQSNLTKQSNTTKQNYIIKEVRIAVSGASKTVVRTTKTEKFLTGKKWQLDSFEQAGQFIKKDIAPISDVRGSAEYRSTVTAQLLLKFYYDLEQNDN